jgi:hypothetical protein
VSRDSSILVWPNTTFWPEKLAARIDRPLFKGPTPLEGREQVVASSAGGWQISYEGIYVYSGIYSAWRAIWIALVAQGKPVYVKPDMITAVPSSTLTTFSDTTVFSDSTYFAQSTGDCVLAAAAFLGDTVISVTNSSTNPKVAGDWFEINGRAHIIQEISGTSWTVWPSLRDDYASATVLEIDDPRVLCYLTPDSRAAAMNTDTRQLTRVTLDFIEAGW